MARVTKKDILFLRTVQVLTRKNRGTPPSYRELQTALGLRSVTPIFSRIQKLRKAEMIEAIPHRARTIHLTKSGITKANEETMQLTKTEEAMILIRREQIAKAEKNKKFHLEILRVAYEYEKWLQENGRGSTYSTFCDDFGYTGDDRPNVFRHVSEIRYAAGLMRIDNA